MTLNIELLRNLVLWAQGRSDRLDEKFAKLKIYDWRQSKWAVETRNGECKTAFCIAGATVAAVDGEESIYWHDDAWYTANDHGNEEIFVGRLEDLPRLDLPEEHPRVMRVSGYARNPRGELVGISTRAAEILGISESEASLLFDGWNSIAAVALRAREIAADHGEVLFP